MTREREKRQFAFPGGKIDRSESIEEALHREIKEELNVTIKRCRKIGTANGETLDGRQLTIYMYEGSISGEPAASAEIEALRWVSAQDIDSDEANEYTPITKGPCMIILRSAKIF